MAPNSLPVRVKICGIREPAEAAALDALGVDWIGFNFHPGSARYVAPEAAAPMARALKHALPVGVFVDAPVDHVISVAKETGMRLIQLHGGEDWDYVRRMPLPVIKAIPHTRLADWGGLKAGLEAALASERALAGEWALSGSGSRDVVAAAPLAYFLVDTAAGKAFGGTGQAFDWDLLKAHPLPLPVILAGGLGPDNLAAALEAAPFAVDLNSKVEFAPGKKDLAKVKACLALVSAAGSRPRS
jgi:phosphoribosylanthranilate isomerase